MPIRTNRIQSRLKEEGKLKKEPKKTIIKTAMVILLVFSTPSIFRISTSSPMELNIHTLTYPSQVEVNQIFAVNVGILYSLDESTNIHIHVYEHGGPLLAWADDNLSGSGSKTYPIDITAPLTPRETWQLNVHLFYEEGVDWVQSDIESIFLDVLSVSHESFSRVIVYVLVQYPDSQPMSEVNVVAINNEYLFRYSAKTNMSGWAALELITGRWSFFAYPGWEKATANQGIGYLPYALSVTLTAPVQEVVLRPDVEVQIRLESSVIGLSSFDMADLIVVENDIACFGPIFTTGIPAHNALTLYTQRNLTARVSLAKKAEEYQPGLIFLSSPINLTESKCLNVSDSNTGRVQIEYRDLRNNPTGGHVQFHVMERSWLWSPNIYDFDFSNPAFIVSTHNLFLICAADDWYGNERWPPYRLVFNNKHLELAAGEEVALSYGGPLTSRVLITPKAASGFKPATQVMLYTTDAAGNVVMEAWGLNGQMRPHLSITTSDSQDMETDMELAFCSKILKEFSPSQNPYYEITYEFGPWGTGQFGGELYDPESIKMIVSETDRLIHQSPSIDRDLRELQVNLYESLFSCMEEAMGVPTDYKIGVISNIMHTGFEDEILHGFKLEIPLEIMFPASWPLGDGYIAHEMGHGRIHKPPANFWMSVSNPYSRLFEAYATLLGYKGRAILFKDDRLFDFLMGGHDLIVRHQHGYPVQSDGDFIETMEFIIYYIDKKYGWEAHKRMILEWANAFLTSRNMLYSNGFTDIEQIAIVYSHIVGENLAWLFELGNFDVREERVSLGLDLILQDQQGNGELKVGETTAITYTASVPIMLRRTTSEVSQVKFTLSFDQDSARLLDVYKRDLTDREEWYLTAISESPGEVTIMLEGLPLIKGPGSIAQVNFELVPSRRSLFEIAILNASINNMPVVAENGGIILDEMSIVRPKNLPFEVSYDDQKYYVTMTCNSTITNFNFNQQSRRMSFDITAPFGTDGFCDITIPKSLMSCSNLSDWSIELDGAPIDYWATESLTDTALYFNYSHSTHKIEIIGTGITVLEDLNDDGTINILDITEAALAFGAVYNETDGMYWHDPRCGNCWHEPVCDVNNDKVVNILDLAAIAIKFGETY